MQPSRHGVSTKYGQFDPRCLTDRITVTFSKDSERVGSHTFVLQTAIRFLSDLHKRSAEFRNFAITSDWVRLLLGAIYPVLVSTDAVNADVELNARDSTLN